MSSDATTVYRDFLDALNAKDLDRAGTFIQRDSYRENCVGFTNGFVDWPEATRSIKQVWEGLPDLTVDLLDVQGGGSSALARGTVSGTALGKLYGAPATKRHYEASFFDWIRTEDGLIVERVQQADVLGQMRQLYGRAFGAFGVSAMLWRLKPASRPGS